MQTEKATSCTVASIAFHNLYKIKRYIQSRNLYTPPGIVDEVDKEGRIHEGEWRRQTDTFSNILSIPSTHSRRSTLDAIGIHNSFKQYFCGAGRFHGRGNIFCEN